MKTYPVWLTSLLFLPIIGSHLLNIYIFQSHEFSEISIWIVLLIYGSLGVLGYIFALTFRKLNSYPVALLKIMTPMTK